MKEQGINLITPENQQKKVERAIYAPSYIIFGIIFVIALVLLIYSFTLHENLNNLKNQAENLRAQINSNNVKKEKMLITSERLLSAKTILETRSDLDVLTAKMLESVPPNFEIQSMNADNKAVSIQMSHDNLFDINEFFDSSIPDLAKKNSKTISTIILNSFTRDIAGYSFLMNFNLKEKGKKS